jgi:hypothetical protein
LPLLISPSIGFSVSLLLVFEFGVLTCHIGLMFSKGLDPRGRTPCIVMPMRRSMFQDPMGAESA